MEEVQRRIADKRIDQNGQIDQKTMYQLIKNLHSHVQSKSVNTEFMNGMKHVKQTNNNYVKKKLSK